MKLRLSHRALVPVVAFAVLGGIVATMMLSRLPRPADEATPSLVRPKSATAQAKKPIQSRVSRKPAKPAAATPVKKKTKPVARRRAARTAATPAKTASPAAARPARIAPAAAPARPAPDPVGCGGLPLVVSRALDASSVAVVALYDPRAGLDEIALAEARAGAAEASVAFVAINVFSERESRPLAELLGVLETPSVLVFRRPDSMFVRIDGFADRDTVAQAAVNARP